MYQCNSPCAGELPSHRLTMSPVAQGTRIPLCPLTGDRMASPTQFPLPNTSEGFSSSSKWPPRLVSYVAKPPSEFLMLSNCPEKQRERLGVAHRQYHTSLVPRHV